MKDLGFLRELQHVRWDEYGVNLKQPLLGQSLQTTGTGRGTQRGTHVAPHRARPLRFGRACGARGVGGW